MFLEELTGAHNIVLNSSVHYSAIRSKSAPNMFSLNLALDKGAYKISLPVHITDMAANLRTLNRCGCIADCIDY